MPSILRWGITLLVLGALAASPGVGAAAPLTAAETGAAPGGADPVSDTRAGIAAAVVCGVSVAGFGRTGNPALIVVAVIACTYMIVDAVQSPD